MPTCALNCIEKHIPVAPQRVKEWLKNQWSGNFTDSIHKQHDNVSQLKVCLNDQYLINELQIMDKQWESELIDRQERNKVWTIILRSVAVSLPTNAKCEMQSSDVTPTKVVWVHTEMRIAPGCDQNVLLVNSKNIIYTTHHAWLCTNCMAILWQTNIWRISRSGYF